MIDQPRTETPWWHERGGFFGEEYKEADDSFRTFFGGTEGLDKRTALEVDGVERLCVLPPGGAVVDCPCGYGRHSVELARRGYRVTGFDINNHFLELARAHAQHLRTSADFVFADMRALPPVDPVDAVINMFYSFGFFADAADDLAVIRGFHQVLKPGGRFLMHTMITVPAFEDGRIPEREERLLRSGNKLLAERRFNPTTRREDGVWQVIEPNGTERGMTPYSMRIYTADEFSELCLEAGFTEIDQYGDWDGKAYEDSSPYLIVVAKK